MRALRSGWMRGAAVALALSSAAPARAQPAPSRVALVIGEGAYRAGPLPAAPDDAGLVAQVLAGAGFDVTGARDLDGEGLRRALRDFLDRAGAAGPDGIAVVYFAGRAVQSDGEDFLVPVDARLARPADVPIEALRFADITHALAALPIQARVVVVDGAYAGGPASGPPGLALVEAEPGELVAFDAAPGTAAPATAGPYGAYAQALVAAIRQGGVPVGEVFDRVRLAVNRATGGAMVPWDSDRLTRSFTFFDRAPGAPALASAQVPFTALEKRPLRDFPPDQAYDVAVARDTLPAYAEFLTAFPDDPLARRVRLVLAVRREALFWRAAIGGGTPAAYWTYLARYPKGPHAADARRRLTRLAAAAGPPVRFAPLPFDVPPPGPDDIADDRVIAFDAPDLPPPPPPPLFLLPPPVELVLVRPPPPPGPAFLPVPVPIAIPYVRPPLDPGAIAPPRGVAGAYPRPRPYARGPNGDGLVAQVAPPEDARPPAPAPNGPQGGAPPRPGAPAVALPNPPQAPVAPAPRGPLPPTAPPARPLPVPDRPQVPAAPAVQRPAAASPAPPSAPPAAPAPAPQRPAAQPTIHPAVAPAAPRPMTEPVAPAAEPPARAARAPRPAALLPAAPAPAAAAPTAPSPAPHPAVPAEPPRAPAPHAPSAGAATRPEPAPKPQAPAPRPEPPPEAPRAPLPPSPPTDHPPGQHRANCGHPGEPPCRP